MESRIGHRRFARMLNKVILSRLGGCLKDLEKSRKTPIPLQEETFRSLLKGGGESLFGWEHNFKNINDLRSFQKAVPIASYNDFTPYIERLRGGENYVLWNQKVRWFAKSSGTSSAKSKFIPITPDSLKINHFGGIKRMIANYLDLYPDSGVFCGKALTLGGSVQPDELGSGAVCGDLSAVMLSNTPKIVEFARTPSRKTALLGDFTKKVELICRECIGQNVTNFAGVPSWNLVMLNKILETAGKENLLDVWPNLELFMHGGTSFEPYRNVYKRLIPADGMHYVENYNASEGYFAFQDERENNGLLLMVNNGIFYEFVPFIHLDKALQGDNSEVVPLEGVAAGIDYAIIVSTCGGLWRYMPEDCVRFTSLAPYRIVVTGRTKLYINAFGEELMIDNAEKAMAAACERVGGKVAEFTVAPRFMELGKKGCHVWAIEFEDGVCPPSFDEVLDSELRKVNSDYDAKRTNDSTMRRLEIISLRPGTFMEWMARRGKLGGQNKVPRLWHNDTFIKELSEL